jgi:carbon-monoxide dehydrogenase large subunit
VSGSVTEAFASAASIVEVEIEQPLLAPMPLEPRATLAEWDAEKGSLLVWTSSQSPHRLRANLAGSLRLDPSFIHVVAADVGGAFGGKASIYPEDVVTAWAAMRLARPVKWSASRSEEFLSASYGRGASLQGELAVDNSGKLVGLRASVAFPLGAWMVYSAVVPAWNASRILPGPYWVPNIEVTARGFVTDTSAVGIYRGAGRPEAAMLMERLLDEAARAVGIDAGELRRRNLVGPESMPFSTPTGQTLDSGDYPALLENCLLQAQYLELCVEREKRRREGKLFGIGIAFYVEPCGRGEETARVCVHADGSITVASGTNPQGQGHETTLAQIAADTLAVPFSSVRVLQGDTRSAPPGVGALASRSIAIGGSAVLEAARQVAARTAKGESRPIEASVTYVAPGEAWSVGCCCAAVAVDADTGEMQIERFVWCDDAGRVINPLLVEGQLVGGFAQGLGQALMEQLVHDDGGQLLTGTLMDYAVPRASDIPDIVLSKLETASPANALGAKGVGESGAIGTPAAILNAAMDALSARKITKIDLPLTSHNLWRALNKESLK